VARDVVGRERVGRLARAAPLVQILAVASQITELDLPEQAQVRPARARRGRVAAVAPRELGEARVVGAQHLRGAVGQRAAHDHALLRLDP